MKTLGTITDPVYVKPAKFTALDRFYLRYIRDERDLPFVKLTVRITLTMLPLAILLYIPAIDGWLWWAIAVAYQFLNNISYKGPFGLMLHCTSHRVLFKKEHSWLNNYIPWVIAPFFGHSPDTYYTHHIGMHHAEGNGLEDESTTMPFQRDRFGDFLKYYGTFLLSGIYHLAQYFNRKKRTKLLVRSVRGEVLFFLFCIALCFVNWPATLCVFIIPFFLYRLVAMMGNWAQHSFVDQDDPLNDYKNSITCINTKYNAKCWNDGYHISHHLKQSMHYTEHPGFFLKTLPEYIKNDAIVFDGIHFLHVYFWLMRGRYDLLAKHFVNLGNRYSSDEEVVDFLKSRTKKFEVGVPAPAMA